MLSQFTKEGDHPTLADLAADFQRDVYPVGRLDADSEGLLLLTNDRSQTSALLDPKHAHEREYLVQVEGEVSTEALARLAGGVELSINGKKIKTAPCAVRLIAEPDGLPSRNPPVRFRKSIPTAWISIALTEGKNRQVRRMTAVVGLPTLRLIRVRIGRLMLPAWIPGIVKELSFIEFREASRR